MRRLKLSPCVPEAAVDAWVTHLRRVRVDGSCAVDLAELALHVGEGQAHLDGGLVGQFLDRALVHGAGEGDAVEVDNSPDVNVEHLQGREIKSGTDTANFHVNQSDFLSGSLPTVR